MSKQRSSLSEVLRQAGGKAIPPRPQPADAREIQPHRVPSRRGKKTIAGFFDPAASRQLKQLALDEGSNVQDLLREAINDLFEKRGKARIA
jgi:Antitoxin-like ribbon-helix-helix